MVREWLKVVGSHHIRRISCESGHPNNSSPYLLSVGNKSYRGFLFAMHAGIALWILRQ